FAKAKGFLKVEGAQMVDAMGHQVAMIEYPGISRDYILEMVHRFYDEYYFRPKAVFRIVRKAVFNSTDRKRLYREAKSFLKLRAARNRSVKESRNQPGTMNPPAPPLETSSAGAKSEPVEAVNA
ncbi:MAG: hopanoid biosynthesis associated radical SAM protein HpnJ, partial [Candidatus Korobacteraceae bacterium]